MKNQSNENQQAQTITFSSQEEFILWLVNNDGKKLRNVHNNLIFYVGSMETPFRISTDEDRPLGNYLGSLGRHWEAEYTIVEPAVEPPKEPEWYECIPEGGLLCWVGDTVGELERHENIRIVVEYDAEASLQHHFIDVDDTCWELAEPVKRCEINLVKPEVCESACKADSSKNCQG